MATITTDTVVPTRRTKWGGGDGRSGPPAARRWSWLWLLVGTLLLPFANLQTLIPLAAWLAPVTSV